MANNKMTAWPLELGAGSMEAPSIILGDAGTGIYRPAANQIGFSFEGGGGLLFAAGYSAMSRYEAGPSIRTYRANGTVSVPTATADGQNLGEFVSYGHTGSAFTAGGAVRFIQDGAVGTSVPVKVTIHGRSSGGTLTEGLVVRASGAVEIKKGVTLGGAATDVITCTGRLELREIANTTNRPGTKRELVYNAADNKVYVCTTASETAATWAALH